MASGCMIHRSIMQAALEKLATTADSSFLAFVREDPAFAFCWHFHAEYELTLILRGRGKRFVGDGIADYHEGDLVLLGPHLPHTWASAPEAPGRRRPHRAVVIQFGRDFLGASFFERPELRAIDRLLQRSPQGLEILGQTRRRVVAQIQQMQRQSGLARLLGLLRVLETLAHSREVRTLSSAGFKPVLHRGDQARIDRVCGHIHAHLTERQPLRDVAALLGMSPRAFTRFFKRTLGKTLVEYMNELRIGHACALLINTDRTVTEIGFASGFNNLAHFNRKFLCLKKLTPRAYRRAFENPLV